MNFSLSPRHAKAEYHVLMIMLLYVALKTTNKTWTTLTVSLYLTQTVLQFILLHVFLITDALIN